MADKWFHYVHKERNTVAKINSDAFAWQMGEMGFQPCSHTEYLKARRLIREREESGSQLSIEGMTDGKTVEEG
jgi:hypothetical protein